MAKLKVFLSYRRDAINGVAQGIVGRIYDRLADHCFLTLAPVFEPEQIAKTGKGRCRLVCMEC